MPPLARQRTLESLRSWWSDRNPNLRGPTINIHAAVKPLMKFMYDRQALEFIKVLTLFHSLERMQRSMEATYLPATMDAVLMILVALAQREGTAAATRSSLVDLLQDSHPPQVVDGVLYVLSEVSPIKFLPVTSGASVEAKLLDHIVNMINDSSTTEWRYSRIFQIVSTLALHEPTAVTVVEANALNSVEKLLRSRPIRLYKHIFPLLENLASHESTAMAVVHTIPFDLLGSLWHKSFEDTTPIDVLASRLEVLVTTKLLGSPRKAIAEATCSSLVALVCDSHILQAVGGALSLLSRAPHIKFPPVTTGVSVEARLLTRIADMLEAPNTSEGHYPVIFQILSHLVLHESTAVAIVEANILNSAEKLLRSRPANLYQYIFPMLENLASHKSTAMAVVRMLPLDLLETLCRENVNGSHRVDLMITELLEVPCQATVEANCSSLVALVCDSDVPHVIDGALWLLSRVPHLKFPPVTTGISVEARLLAHIADILEAPNTSERHYPVIFQILSHLVLHESTSVAIVEARLLARIAYMLEAPNTSKRHYPVIFQILSHLALHKSTAVAIVEANILNPVEKLLQSCTTNQYKLIFAMLESLASHESTATAVLNMRLYDLLATLWYRPLSLTLSVIDLLACMARWRDGTEGVVAMKALDNVLNGLQSFNPYIRLSTCQLLEGNNDIQEAIEYRTILPPCNFMDNYIQGTPALVSVMPVG
ncbi:hypothetical protein C8J57DRAFT_1578934 [Mycena rebaudengoi]|nr:hypothetical protein C8J57DRAFT_1578934 [Mycena rebaudengoi]